MEVGAAESDLSVSMSLSRPYCLADVEPRARERVSTIRDDMHGTLGRLWQDDAGGGPAELRPLPPLMKGETDVAAVRSELKLAQLRCAVCQAAIARATGRSKTVAAHSDRLHPLDGVLERLVVMTAGVLWLPYIPLGQVPVIGEPIEWREWLFKHCHESVINCHRSSTETYQLLRRMGYWETLAKDNQTYYDKCEICLRYRGRTLRPVSRCIGADDKRATLTPFQDVMVDMSGPYTQASGGDDIGRDAQYVLSY